MRHPAIISAYTNRRRLQVYRANRRGLWGWSLLMTALFCLFVVPSVASADDSGRIIYWRLDSQADAKTTERFERELIRTLEQAEERHLLSDKAIAKHIKKNLLLMPICYEGVQPCESAPAQLIEALRVQGLVYAQLTPAGSDWALTLRYWRESGGSVKTVQLTDGDFKRLVREGVGSIFTLEALVSIETNPAGAVLFVNDRRVGPSPASIPLGEGMHTLRVELEGYNVLRETVTLTPGEARELALNLIPKLTQITVITSAPGAEVYIDDRLLGAAGDPIEVKPGERKVELRAPGHEPIGMNFEIKPSQRATLQFAMLRSTPKTSSLREEGVSSYRLFLQAYYGLTFQDVAFDVAATSNDGTNIRATAYDDGDRASLVYNGLGFALGYTGEIFGLIFLDLGFGWGSLGGATLTQVDSGLTSSGSDGSVFRVGLRALQMTARYLMGSFSVNGTTGFGVGFDSLTINDNGQTLNFNETEAFWTLAAAGRYHWAEQWYATLGYHIEVDFGGDRGVRHGLMLGIGYNLPWLKEGDDDDSSDAPDQVDEPDPINPLSVPDSQQEPSTIDPFAPAPAP